VLTLLGVEWRDKEFSNLTRSTPMEAYYNTDKMYNQNLYNGIKVGFEAVR